MELIKPKYRYISWVLAVLCFISLVGLVAYYQFIIPNLYGVDGYYHIRVADFIRQLGPRYEFKWAQFSSFKPAFADKDFLFHALILHFTRFSDIVTGAKFAVIFMQVLLILLVFWFFSRYLPPFLATIFLLSLFLSPLFFVYSAYLRPATLANIITIILVYALINKKNFLVFVMAFIYPITHLSFPLALVYAVICEIARYCVKREFHFRNIYLVLIAILLGILIHPNFPNNALSYYVNGFLVPWYIAQGINLGFGSELYPISSKYLIIQHIVIFFGFFLVLLNGLFCKVKTSLSTVFLFFCAVINILFAFSSNRFWYHADLFCFFFFASYLHDWISDDSFSLKRLRIIMSIWFLALAGAYLLHIGSIHDFVLDNYRRNSHFEEVGKWMDKNIPAGEVIFHSGWDQSPYFICFNPKNYYLVVLDPIYMFYWDPGLYPLYQELANGKLEKYYEVITEVFNTKYGYIYKKNKLYAQVKEDERFEFIYEDNQGLVFKIADNTDF